MNKITSIPPTQASSIGNQLSDPFINVLKNNKDNCIALIRDDRFNNNGKLNEFLTASLKDVPVKITDHYVDQNPFTALVALTLRNNPDTNLRERAVAAYKKAHPEEKTFEACLAYLKDPQILIAQHLLGNNLWVADYNDEMFGMFNGSLSFDPGQTITKNEMQTILSKCKDEKEKTEFLAKFIENNDSYTIPPKDQGGEWVGTPQIHGSQSRVDDLFLPSRIVTQDAKLNGYVTELNKTSDLLIKMYNLTKDGSHAILVIGPLGVGKSHFNREKFGKDSFTCYSADAIKEKLVTGENTPDDYHWESSLLSRKLLTKVDSVPALLDERVAVDEFRFNRMINRDYGSRTKIIEELYTSDPETTVKRYKSRQGQSVSDTHEKQVRDTLDASNANRDARIKASLEKKLHYKLYKDGELILELKDGEVKLDKEGKTVIKKS